MKLSQRAGRRYWSVAGARTLLAEEVIKGSACDDQEGCLGFGVACKRLLQPRPVKPPQGHVVVTCGHNARRGYGQ